MLRQLSTLSYGVRMISGLLPIARHKTAIRRGDFSLPVKCLLRDGLLDANVSLFDYGCGHGENIWLLSETGIRCEGWDPVYRPGVSHVPSDIVNLGYVINVIEDPIERTATLQSAWALCQKMIAVSAQIKIPGPGTSQTEFGDGVVTRLGTFQKYFTQAELREYIQSALGADAIPAALGVFYVFKDESLRQQYLATHYQRPTTTPKRQSTEAKFEVHRELLEPLMAAISAYGRLPEPDEFECSAIVEKIGSVKRAFALIKNVTGTEAWDAIRQRRSEDMLVYLALSRFRSRPPIRKLPLGLQRDIRAFFGSYKRACDRADALLFLAGDAEAIDAECRQSNVGKLLPTAIYVHRSALAHLAPLLRIFEGCARSYVGEIAEANLIKLHRYSGKVSYLSYPKFEKDPHPTLALSVKVSLRSLELDCYNYSTTENPPILHRKETFLHGDHPLYAKFHRLTQQEERCGLLDETNLIGTQRGWQNRLQESGVTLRGHRVVKAS
jgi:DNA phosphorothioation-associated putative methyltransferase